MATIGIIDCSGAVSKLILCEENGGRAKLEICSIYEISIDAESQIVSFSSLIDNSKIILLPEKIGDLPDNRVLAEVIGRDISVLILILPAGVVLYNSIVLPFDDQKKVDQIVPLQLQDLIPLEADELLTQAHIMGKISANEYQIVTASVPKSIIASSLDFAHQIGAEPKIITTFGSGLITIGSKGMDRGEPHFRIVSNIESITVAFFQNQLPVRVREISCAGSDFNSEIRAFIMRHKRETNAVSAVIYGRNEQFRPLLRELGLTLYDFSLADIIGINRSLKRYETELNSALLVIAAELRIGVEKHPRTLLAKRSQRSFNFRQQEFSFRSAWSGFFGAFADEGVYIALAAIFFLLWIGVHLYSGFRIVSELDSVMAQRISTVIPGSAIPPGGELAFVENEVDDLEEKLSSIGSLSSVSPLDSLKELSEAISSNVDVEFDSININQNGFFAKGTVGKISDTGLIDSMLKARKARFCEVKTEPSGSVGRSNRTAFTVNVTFCS